MQVRTARTHVKHSFLGRSKPMDWLVSHVPKRQHITMQSATVAVIREKKPHKDFQNGVLEGFRRGKGQILTSPPKTKFRNLLHLKD